jgi:peptidoglycan/xylan/chitin deacetylase (PgdA/CDA1 family)
VILTYHKIKCFKGKDAIATGLIPFFLQMFLIRKKHVVYLEEYTPANEDQFVITFDDGYREVIKYALPVLRIFKYPFEIFVVGDFIKAAESGNKNYLDTKDIAIILKNRGRLQYHSRTHPHLELINDLCILEDEIKPPEWLRTLDPKGFKYFAYPFWVYNNDVITLVKKYYCGARSGNGCANDTVYALDSKRL